MTWLKQLFLAILEFFAGEIKQDKKASDADKTPEELKNKWRERIMEVEKKANEDSKNDSTD